MTGYAANGEVAPISLTNTTALLLIDNQLGYRHPANGLPSTANYETNVTSLLAALRAAIDASPVGSRPCIIHVQHKSAWTDSPMHPDHVGPYGPHGEEKRGIEFLEFAAPRLLRDGRHQLVYTFDEPSAPPPPPQTDRPPFDEIIMTKHGHSVWINTPLEHLLNKRGIKTLLVAGMTTDYAVSTAVRMAHNLALVGKWGGRGNMVDVPEAQLWTDGRGVYLTAKDYDSPDAADGKDGYLVDMPRLILLSDATRTFAAAGVDADTVQKVHIESLRPFAEIRSTEEVISALV